MSFYSHISKRIDNHYYSDGKLSDKKTKELVSLKLRLYRKTSGVTFAQIAKMVGVTRHAVMRWETRKSKPSNLAMIKLKELFII